MFTWSLYSDLQLQFTRNRLHYALQTVGASICRRFQRVGVTVTASSVRSSVTVHWYKSPTTRTDWRLPLYILCPISNYFRMLANCWWQILGLTGLDPSADLCPLTASCLDWDSPVVVPLTAAMVPGVVHGAIPLSLELTAVVACVQ